LVADDILAYLDELASTPSFDSPCFGGDNLFADLGFLALPPDFQVEPHQHSALVDQAQQQPLASISLDNLLSPASSIDSTSTASTTVPYHLSPLSPTTVPLCNTHSHSFDPEVYWSASLEHHQPISFLFDPHHTLSLEAHLGEAHSQLSPFDPTSTPNTDARSSSSSSITSSIADDQTEQQPPQSVLVDGQPSQVAIRRLPRPLPSRHPLLSLSSSPSVLAKFASIVPGATSSSSCATCTTTEPYQHPIEKLARVRAFGSVVRYQIPTHVCKVSMQCLVVL
jgi:hypothetical protein